MNGPNQSSTGKKWARHTLGIVFTLQRLEDGSGCCVTKTLDVFSASALQAGLAACWVWGRAILPESSPVLPPVQDPPPPHVFLFSLGLYSLAWVAHPVTVSLARMEEMETDRIA